MSSQDVALAGSLLPKCDELARMADALTSAIDRRRAILLLSKAMHEQIAAVCFILFIVIIKTSSKYDVSSN